MSIYEYKARDKSGKVIRGTMTSDSEDAVASKLEEMGHLPVLIEKTEGESSFSRIGNMFLRKKVSLAEINVFTRQLHTLQKAGLPILSSLLAIKEQASNPTFKAVINKIIVDVEGGTSLSDAMQKHKKVFNPLYTTMIKSGEASGKLVEILDRLAILGERDGRIRMRVNAALRYPIIVICAIIISFIVLIINVIPKFESLYTRYGADLPLATQLLININKVVSGYWWVVLPAIALLIIFFRKMIDGQRGNFLWDNFKLHVPVFGPILKNMVLSRFSRITGTLMKSGVPLLQILELVSDSMGSVVVEKGIKHICAGVEEGKSMSSLMKETGLFPPIVLQMVSVGEDTGKVDDLLLYVSEYYDTQVDYAISNLVVMIEPMLILVLGIGVAIMALGIFTPMWKIIHIFRN